MDSLKQKRVLVTGASAGLGLAICHQVAREGGYVVGVARNQANLDSNLGSLSGSGHRWQSLDVSTLNFTDFVKNVQPLDGLVHSAGSAHFLPSQLIQKKNIDEALYPHLYAPLLLSLELIRAGKLKANASVVFLSSTSSQKPGRGQLLYSIAKASLANTSQVLTAEFSSTTKIRFNCLLPGFVPTERTSATVDRLAGPEWRAAETAETPLGPGTPEDIAEATCFLLSDRARWISGSSFVVDGGRLCKF